MRVWEKFLPDRDREVFGVSGYGARAGLGKRPALLVVDVNWAFCGDKNESILESIKKWRNSCGEDAWAALEFLRPLILTARSKGVPVIYTTNTRRADNWDGGSWNWKSSRAGEDAVAQRKTNLDPNAIVTPIEP